MKKHVKILNEIYNEFWKNTKYYNGINIRIRQIFERKTDYTLDKIENLVNNIKTMRTIVELRVKIVGRHFFTVKNVRGYMH